MDRFGQGYRAEFGEVSNAFIQCDAGTGEGVGAAEGDGIARLLNAVFGRPPGVETVWEGGIHELNRYQWNCKSVSTISYTFEVVRIAYHL